MQVTSRIIGKTLYIYPDGEIDESSVALLRLRTDEIIERSLSCEKVVFNLSAVHFMDSTGIGFLIGRYKKLKGYNISSFVENPNFSADRVLTLSGVYSLMPKK